MAAKLKSISSQIHWSLVLKAAVFALAWILLPFWLFAIVALCLYFIPWFQAEKLIIPFFALLILAYVQPASWIPMLVFGALFYIILLVKDLLLIDRKSVYEILVLALSFLFLRSFYIRFETGISGYGLFYSFFIAIIFAMLIASFMDCFREEKKGALRRAVVWLSFVLMWQFAILGLFLPVDFVYQSVIVFLGLTLFVDLVPEYLFGTLSRAKILAASTVIPSLLIIVLASARWGI